MIKHVGYDRDGDKVWQVGPDAVIGHCVNKAEVRRAMATRTWKPFTKAEYEAEFGPITKEPPR